MSRVVSNRMMMMTIPETVTTLALGFLFVMLSKKAEYVECQLNPLYRLNFRSLLEFKEYEAEEDEECSVGGNFCQNGGTCTKLRPNDVRLLSASNEMIFRLQLAALSSTENERQRILGFRCSCTTGYEGEFCQKRTLSSMILVPGVWLICVAVAAAVCLVALIITIIICRNRSKPKTNDEWGLVKTSTGDLEKVRLQRRVVGGKAYLMLDQKEAGTAVEKSEDEGGQASAAEEGNEETDRQQNTASSVARGPEPVTTTDLDIATTQLSQHSGQDMYDSATHTLDPTEAEATLRTEDGGGGFTRRKTVRRSALNLVTSVSEARSKSIDLPDGPATHDEDWGSGDPSYAQPLLQTSNRSTSNEGSDEGNANPLVLGRAYSSIDDTFQGSNLPIHDHTRPYMFHHGDNDVRFSDGNSQVSPNAPESVERAEQRRSYEWNHSGGGGLAQPTEASEQPPFFPSVHRGRSLDHLLSHGNALQPDNDDNRPSPSANNVDSHQMTRSSESYGLAQPNQRSETLYVDKHAVPNPSFDDHSNSQRHNSVYWTQASNIPEMDADRYRNQANENSNIQRKVILSRIEKTSNIEFHEDVDSFENQENQQIYLNYDNPEDSHFTQPDKSVRYSENDSLYYNDAQERSVDDQYQRHTALSTILENDYDDENTELTYSHEKLLFSRSAQKIVELHERTEYLEDDQLSEEPQQTSHSPEMSQSNESVEQILHIETLQPYARQPRKSRSDDPQFSENVQPTKTSEYAAINSGRKLEGKRHQQHSGYGLHEAADPKSDLDKSPGGGQSSILKGQETKLKPKRSKSHSYESSQATPNQSANSNSLQKQMESKQGTPNITPVQLNQLTSGSTAAPHSVGNINASSENQNQSNPDGSRSEFKNTDRNVSSLPLDTVVSGNVNDALPSVIRQAKKSEKEKTRRNRNRNRSNPWSLISGKPVINEKKTKAGSPNNVLKQRRPEKPQLKQNSNTSQQSNSTHKSDDSSRRDIDKAINQKSDQHGSTGNGSAIEMSASKNKVLLNDSEESLQHRSQIACCDNIQNEQEKTKERQLRNSLAEQRPSEKVQNEQRFFNKNEKTRQLIDQSIDKKALLEKSENEREELVQTQSNQQLKEGAQKEQQLESKSVCLLDETYEKQKAFDNEHQIQLRIEEAHRNHQLLEKTRKDQLRSERAHKHLLQPQTTGVEHKRFEVTTKDKLQIGTAQQECQRSGCAKKTCLGSRNAKRGQARFKNARKEIHSLETSRHENTLQKQQLLEQANEKMLRVENVDDAQGRFENSLQERLRFENAHMPHNNICSEVSGMTRLQLEQTENKVQLPGKARTEEVRCHESREEHALVQHLLEGGRLLPEISQKKPTSFKNGQKQNLGIDSFGKEGIWLKYRQRERRQREDLQEETTSSLVGQKEQIWKNRLTEYLRADNLKNRQREPLQFQTEHTKSPWPQNTEREHLQFDILPKKDLRLKREQKQIQSLKFSHLQEELHCKQNDREEHIRFVDISQEQRARPLEKMQKDEQLWRRTAASRRSISREEGIQDKRVDGYSGDQGRQQQPLWTKSLSSLSVRLPQDASSSSSRRRSYSDVALALKDSLENLNNACSSIFQHARRFCSIDNDEFSSEWDTIAERTAESDLELGDLFVSSAAGSSEQVNLKSSPCEPYPRIAVADETKSRAFSEPISTTKKAWKLGKSELASNDLSTALMDELKAYLARYRLQVATSSDDVLNEDNNH